MEVLVNFVKDFLTPGSITFLLFGLIAMLPLLYSRERFARWGRRGLVLLSAFYWIISTPVGTDLLLAGLDRGYVSLSSRNQAAGATAIVALTGGSLTYRARGDELSVVSDASAFRALEAARVYTLLGDPWIIVSGGIGDPQDQLEPESAAMKDELLKRGIPADRILIESSSQTTHDQAINIVPLLREHKIDRFVLITSGAHMWRAVSTFRASGLEPTPSVAADRSEGLPEDGNRFFPKPSSLLASQSAFREYISIVYYWSRGWLAVR